MKKQIWVMFLLGIMFIAIAGLTSAVNTDLGTFPINEEVRIAQVCRTATFITLTSITYPNSSIAISQINMTSEGSGEFSYNFTNTSVSGRYEVKGISDGCEETFITTLTINPSGIAASESRTNAVTRSMYFLFIVSILLFLAFLFVPSKTPIKWTYFLISIMFFLQAINILFVGLKDEVVNPKIESYFSFLTSSSFILFWFAFGLLAVMWFLTTIQSLLLRKNKMKEERNNG